MHSKSFQFCIQNASKHANSDTNVRYNRCICQAIWNTEHWMVNLWWKLWQHFCIRIILSFLVISLVLAIENSSSSDFEHKFCDKSCRSSISISLTRSKRLTQTVITRSVLWGSWIDIQTSIENTLYTSISKLLKSLWHIPEILINFTSNVHDDTIR